MDWGSLIGAGASALGGLVSGGKKETSTTQTTTLSPELQDQITQIFQKIPQIFGRPYPQYQGERVAGPTTSRQSIDQFLPAMSSNIMSRMTQPNRYQQRINQVLDQAPPQISVPTLLGQQAPQTLYGGYGSSDINRLAAPTTPSWLSPQ